MAYCTIEQLTDRYGEQLLIELSDRGAVAPEAPDADLFARAIADADAAIDAYLARRYALPLAATPAIITDISQRLAIYNAHSRSVSDKIKADYEAAMRQLREIADGKARLDVAGVEPEGSGDAQVRTNDREQVMTPTSMKGFI